MGEKKEEKNLWDDDVKECVDCKEQLEFVNHYPDGPRCDQCSSYHKERIHYGKLDEGEL